MVKNQKLQEVAVTSHIVAETECMLQSLLAQVEKLLKRVAFLSFENNNATFEKGVV